VDKSAAELSSELYEKLYLLKTQAWKSQLFGENLEARVYTVHQMQLKVLSGQLSEGLNKTRKTFRQGSPFSGQNRNITSNICICLQFTEHSESHRCFVNYQLRSSGSLRRRYPTDCVTKQLHVRQNHPVCHLEYVCSCLPFTM
jgi:hypothetical protein